MFVEFDFREGLIYAKNLKSKNFKDPQFWGPPRLASPGTASDQKVA